MPSTPESAPWVRFATTIASLWLMLSVTACQVPILDEWLLGEETPPVRELRMLSWRSSAAADAHLQGLIEEFNTTHPNAHVTLQLTETYRRDLQRAMIQNAPPDLFLVDSLSVPDFVTAGALAPLSNLVEPDSDIYPILRDAITINGQSYCFPRDIRTLALVYNTDLFDAAGLTYPDETWGWNELRAAAEAIAADTNPFYTTYGMVLSADLTRWLPFLYQAGGDFANLARREMAVNTPQALESLNFYLNLVLEGHAIAPIELSSRWNGEAFGKGRVGMTIEGNWVVPYLAATFPDLAYGIAPLPTGPQGRATLAFSTCYGVSAASKHADIAFQLMAHLTSAESLRQLSESGQTMPARISLGPEWRARHPAQAPFFDSVAYARVWQFGPGFQQVVDAVNGSMKQVFDAEVTAEEVLRVAEVVGNEAFR